MAATRPIWSQPGVMVVWTMSAASWNVSPATSQRANSSQTERFAALLACRQHCAEDPDGGFDGTDRNDEERQRLQHERDVVRGKVQGVFHDLCRRAHDAAETIAAI